MSPEMFDTTTMSLVAYLRYAGFAPLDSAFDLEHDECVWYFSDSSRLREEVRKFRANKVLVHPKEYSRAYAQTKRDMHDARIRAGVDR